MANNQIVYTLELKNGNAVKNIDLFIKKNMEGAQAVGALIDANAKLIALAKLAADKTSVAFKKLETQILANKKQVLELNKELGNAPKQPLGELEKSTVKNAESVGKLLSVAEKLRNEVKLLSFEIEENKKIQNSLKSELEKVAASASKNSDSYEDLEQQLKSLEQRERENIKLLQQLRGELDKTDKAASTSSGGFASFSKNLKSLGGLLAAKLTFDTIKGAFIETVRVGANFEEQLLRIKAVANASNIDIQKMEQKILSLGASTKFSSSEIGVLVQGMVQMGFTLDEVNQMLEHSINLSLSTGSSLEKTSTLIGATIKAYSLNSQEAARLSDIFSLSTANSALNINKLEGSLSELLPISKSVGISVADTVGILGGLANVQLDSSKAGNQMKKVLGLLGTEGSKLSKYLNIVVKDSATLEKALVKLSKATIDNKTAFELVGEESKAALISLSNQANTIRGLVKSYNEAEGASKRIASIQSENLNNSYKEFLSIIETIEINLTKLSSSTLNLFIGGLTKAASLFNDLIKKNPSKSLEEQRFELNKLVIAIQSTNNNEAKRIELIDELKAKFPNFLKDLDSEKITNDLLTKSLEQYNQQLINKIIIQKQEEQISKLIGVAADKKILVGEREETVLRKLTEVTEKYNITLLQNASLSEKVADAIEQLESKSNGFGRIFNPALNAQIELRKSLGFLSVAQDELANASINSADAIEKQKGNMLALGENTGEAKDNIEALKLKLEELKKNRLEFALKGIDTSGFEASIERIEKELKALETGTDEPLIKPEKITPSSKTVEEKISILETQINRAIEATDFDLAKRLVLELDKFGELGEVAAKKAIERILKAQIASIDQNTSYNNLLLEAEYLRNEESLKSFIETEKSKLSNLDNINKSKLQYLGEVSEQEKQIIEDLAENETDYQAKRLKVFLSASNKKLELLRQAGKTETEEYQKISNDILKAEIDFENFKSEKLKSISNEKQLSKINFLKQEIQLIGDLEERQREELKSSQSEELRAFEATEKQRLEAFAQSQASIEKQMKDAQYEETLINRKLEENRTEFTKQQQKRREDLDKKHNDARLKLDRNLLVKKREIEAEFLSLADDKKELKIGIDIAQQISDLQDQLDKGEISLKEYDKEVEKIEKEGIERYKKAEKERTDTLIEELEKRVEILKTGDESERLLAEKLANKILAIKKKRLEDGNKLQDESNENTKEGIKKLLEDINKSISIAIQVTSLVGDFFADLAEHRLSAIDKKINQSEERVKQFEAELEGANERETLSIEAKLKHEEELQAQYDKKKKDIEKAEFVRNQANRIAEALQEAALMAIKIFDKPPLLIGLAALTAAKIGVIASQEFAYKDGGLLAEKFDKILSSYLQFETGGFLSDGLKVLSGGNVPSRKGIITGNLHSQGGVKAITRSGRNVEFEGGEITTVQGQNDNAIRLIYNRNVAKSPFFKRIALMTESNKIDAEKLAVGSFINSFTGGFDFMGVGAKANPLPTMKFQYGGSLLEKMTPTLPMNVIYKTIYADGGAIGGTSVSVNDDLVKKQIEIAENQKYIMERQLQLITYQNELLKKNTTDIANSINSSINSLEANPTIPFTKKVIATQQKIEQLEANAK